MVLSFFLFLYRLVLIKGKKIKRKRERKI